MFKRFILATDLSPASYVVAGCLGGLKAFGAEQCLLLFCLSFNEALSEGFSYNTDRLDRMLREQQGMLKAQDFTVEPRIVVGVPKQEIVRIAESEGYALIVVGAQGHSLAEEKMLGGIAYGVINKSARPVMVVPVEKAKGAENTCKPVARIDFAFHILFPTDFSEMDDKAFTYVEQLVAQGVSKVTLVHVQDRTQLEKHLEPKLEEFNAQDRKRLENLKLKLLEQGDPRIDIEVCYGAPSEEITRLVRDRDVQLVIMGTQGRGFIREFFLGSVSHHVARTSIAPVLLIPAQQQRSH